jgi:ATP-dependent DNA helicase RecG
MHGVIKGRMPVKTWFIDNKEERISKMHDWIKTQIKDNGRAIFVYPLIEDSDKSGFKSLESEYKKIKEIYGQSGAGFIHSRLSSEEKNTIMESFKSGEIKILTATTVVEVGIDVPEANVIVIENADNYGLSTLHQLRGRVGRNNKQGYMVLIADEAGLTEDGKKRIDIMTHENDGFAIAEEDLLLRGPGDFLGSRQSGLPDFKFADIRSDLEILKEASEDAEELFQYDGDLSKTENLNTKAGFLHRLKTYIANYSRGDA